MARNTIVLKGGNGQHIEFAADSGIAFYPGMAARITSTGKYSLGTGGGDGQRGTIVVVKEDSNLGKTATTVYATAAERVYGYIPQPGDECLILVDAAVGALVIGDLMICDQSEGNYIKTTGTPEIEPFEILEAVTVATNDTLVMARYTGN